MPQMLKKTAVIGLGGTGMNAVLHMKRRLLQTYGRVPPMIKFLVIDTTDKDDLTTVEGQTELLPGEFLKLTVKNPAGLISTNREVRDWLPEGVPLFALSTGARQVRALGRLAVFANAAPIEAAIEGLLSSLKDWNVGRDSEHEVISEDIVVNLVCSLAGGTGSGCYFDVAVLTKNRLNTTDKLIGYFLMPDVFNGKAATDNVEPNAYGALREINAAFDGLKSRYTLNGRPRSVPDGMFTAAYLINNTNRHGVQYNSERDLHEFLAMGMILQSSTAGKGAQDVIDNLESQLIGKRWFGKPTVFSSFGISELVYPGEWYSDLHARKLAIRTIQNAFQGGDLGRAEEFTGDFIRRAGIGEHESDDVIDALGDPSTAPRFPIPTSLNARGTDQVFSRRRDFIRETERQSHDRTLANAERFTAEKTALLEGEVGRLLQRPQGLEFVKAFMSALVAQLSEFRNEMTTEQDSLEEQRDAVESRYASAETRIKTATEAFFGTKKKTDEALRSYKSLVDQEVTLIVEIERRERAIDFFVSMLNEADRLRTRVESLLAYCEAVTQELFEEIERLQRQRRDRKPFVEELTPRELTEVDIETSPDDFLKWLRETEKVALPDLGELRLDEFRALLLRYAYSNDIVDEMRSRKIDDLLKEMPARDRVKCIHKLDMMAAPLWQYDQGIVAGDKHTENIYLFGVEDGGRTVFTPENIRDAVATPWEPKIISTGDSKRIVCFKVEAAVPVFVVSHVPRYREKYQDPNRPFPYHLHKEWETTLPEVFPGAEEEDARRYWSLALATPFGLIIKRGPYYYVRSAMRGERTKDYLVRLAQGRAEAMRAFVQDGELVAEIRDAIERLNEEIGNKQMVEKLKAYGEGLERQVTKQGEQIRKQIELELQDIEQYILSIASL